VLLIKPIPFAAKNGVPKMARSTFHRVKLKGRDQTNRNDAILSLAVGAMSPILSRKGNARLEAQKHESTIETEYLPTDYPTNFPQVDHVEDRQSRLS
jgi:hypothetical protein